MFHGHLGMGTTSSAVQDKIRQVAISQGVPPDLALSVASRESGFSQSARGASGEVGIFQLMPGTARDLGVNPADLDSNIYGGISYLAQMYAQFGDWGTALAAYNCGPTCAASGKIPASTQQYVSSVLANRSLFTGMTQPVIQTWQSTDDGSLVTEIPSSPDFIGLPVDQAGVSAGVDMGMVGLIAILAVVGIVALT